MTVLLRSELAGLLAGPVAAVARSAGLPWPAEETVPVEACREARHGDFSSRVAFLIAGRLPAGSALPREIGREILAALPAAGGLLERAEVAGPGYLNFTLRRERWMRALAAAGTGVASGAEGGAAEPPAAGAAAAAARAALGRIGGIFRARAAAGAPPPGGAVDRALLIHPAESALARRAALLAESVAGAAEAPEIEEQLAALAEAFREYDARVRLVSPDERVTRARLHLVASAGCALRAGLARLHRTPRGDR